MEIMKGAEELFETEWWDAEMKKNMHVEEHDHADYDWLDGETWEEKTEEDAVEEEEWKKADKQAKRKQAAADREKKK